MDMIKGIYSPVPLSDSNSAGTAVSGGYAGGTSSFKDTLDEITSAEAASQTIPSGVTYNNPLHVPDEEYENIFGLTYDHGKLVYFPPRDAPVEVQQQWYDYMKDKDAGEAGELKCDIIDALSYGDYYSNAPRDIQREQTTMMNRLNSLGTIGTLELMLNAKGHMLSDVSFSGLIDAKSKQQNIDQYDFLTKWLDSMPKTSDDVARIALADQIFAQSRNP